MAKLQQSVKCLAWSRGVHSAGADGFESDTPLHELLGQRPSSQCAYLAPYSST